MTNRPLPANAPLVLDDPHRAWQLTTGRAHVFALLEGADSKRIPLFSLDEGDVAFPAPPGSGAGLLMVGLAPDTAVAAVDLPAEGDAEAGTGEETEEGAEVRHLAGDELRQVVESWVEHLADALGDPSPREGSPIGDEAVELSEGDTAWPERRTIWAKSSGGLSAISLFGDAPLDGARYGRDLVDDPTVDQVVPLPVNAWLRAAKPTRISVVPAAQALLGREGWKGLDAFQRAAMRRLQTVVERRRRKLESALAERTAQEARVDERVYGRLSRVLEHEQPLAGEPSSDDPVQRAMALVADSMGVTLAAPESLSEVQHLERVEAIARASGIRWRRVTLEGRWWRRDSGALYVTRLDGSPAALLSRRSGVTDLVDPDSGVRRRVTSAVAKTLGNEAVMLYRPLPRELVTGRHVLSFLRRSTGKDLWRLIVIGVAIGVLSLVTPLVTKFIFSTIVPDRRAGVLVGLTVLLVVFAASSFGFSVVQRQALARMSGHVANDLQSALWDRVLEMPLGFFRRYSSGSLATKVMAVDTIQQLATATVTTSMLLVPVGLANLILAFFLQARLAAFGLVALVAGAAGIVAFSRTQTRHLAALTEAHQAAFGTAMQFVDGVGKLRVANAERRAFARWATIFASLKEAFVASQRGFATVTAFSSAGTAVVTLALFLAVVSLGAGAVTPDTFIAFNTAFAQALAATVGLTGVAVFLAQSKPLYNSVRPVLETAPELTVTGSEPGRLSGSIEVSHVGFRYSTDGPLVLEDVSFTVEPGRFLALVGPSGSGKSSMLRILLGFEGPEVGSVRYDGKDLDSLDVAAVRRQIGVVTQSVRLLPGDMFTNIVGNRPLTMDDAWEAAETAGIADDIRAMPMQMHTFVAEGASTFSGGQRQRLLIARAVAAKPKVLFFDEATSALDNRTQAHVTDAIARLRATRVVIAHRLSTVRAADQILVLDRGRVAESGTYEELAGAGGPFARLTRRQLV
ncbi:MAG TPA: NHLP bacteriocin export ABC transporter permease/ATPase subunit [Acidimicrobiales bacterium]|nr:NHLP bacteriocin export ABC transporter permease/ATPase subunit [Acidimicrobiales bacterium]